MLSEGDATHANDACRRLLAAAAEEFARHGFASARIRAIVDAAGVKQAAVNYYFGGKEGLYRATLKYLAAKPRTARRQGSEARSPEERLQGRIHGLLDRFICSRRV